MELNGVALLQELVEKVVEVKFFGPDGAEVGTMAVGAWTLNRLNCDRWISEPIGDDQSGPVRLNIWLQAADVQEVRGGLVRQQLEAAVNKFAPVRGGA